MGWKDYRIFGKTGTGEEKENIPIFLINPGDGGTKKSDQ